MKSTLLRTFLIVLSLQALYPQLFAQHVQMVQNHYEGDSSYYDIARIAPNRYWMAGENGLLNEIDSEGNIHKVDFPNPNVNLLRIQAHNQQIYIGTDQGGLYKYDLETGYWSQAAVPKSFDKRCFYDMLLLPEENKLLVSGGHQKIAKGQKTLPLGFIASIDLNFQEDLKIEHKNSLSFVWALAYSGGQVYAASFTGINTKILRASPESLSFKKQSSVPGLVHHLEASEGSVFYSGTATTKYAQHGIAGKVDGAQQWLEGYGCIWSIKQVGDQWIALDYAGDVLLLNEEMKVEKRIEISQHSLYELETTQEGQAFIIGHGGKIAALDLNRKDRELSAKK